MKRLTIVAAISALIAVPAMALQPPQEDRNTPRSILDRLLDRVLGPEEQAEQADESLDSSTTLNAVLAADFRSEDRARDIYRHPAETLAFFRVEPEMTVAEYSPGGGWYTRVLAPWIAPQGRYYAIGPDRDDADLNAQQRADANAWPTSFPLRVQQWTGLPASAITAFESDDIPAGLEGTADRILTFRNIHSFLNADNALSELRNLRRLLADDGLIGVVEHRAPENETWERANGSRGYVKTSDVIALFDVAGFEPVGRSEVNANPNDTADWEIGVWTLPPTLRLGDQDRDRYTVIGESDRMTLLFRKAN